MIRKMNKYSFVVFHKELPSFLEELQKLGMVDITRQHKAVDDKSKEYFDLLKRYDTAMKTVNSIIAAESEKAEKAGTTIEPLEYECADKELLEVTEMLLERRTAFLTARSETKRNAAAARPWGEFNFQDIKRLKQMDLVPHFYVLNVKRFNDEWNTSYPLTLLNEVDGYKYFVILSPEGEPYSFEYAEAKLPDCSSGEYEAEMQQIDKEIAVNIQRLKGMQQRFSVMSHQRGMLAEKADLYLADASSVREAENHIAVLEGFAPADQDSEVKKVLDSSGVLYLSDKAKVEDNPPINLKNNFFTRMFEPIGSLYMLPRYDELDLTPYFAPFYMLFFGLCLGDMGYGLVLLLVGLGVISFLPKMKSYGWLIMFLGIGSIIMPALGGTFFGTKIYEVFTLPDAVNDFFFSDLKLFWFSIIFGIVQIIFGRLLNAVYNIANKGWQYGMSNLGWAILVAVLSLMYAGSQMGKEFIPKNLMLILLSFSALLILFFSKTEGNIFKRLFSGVTSLYDITGFFGDMLSYIRLFGLGTAGGILGMVVNSIAMQLSGIPYLGWVLTVVMLLFGHIFVMLLSLLGAFVHPLRLTFVEFYKNAGFTGGGKAYKPLKKSE